jgi:5-methylcytosine-specific restriction endonuclease McrA
MADQPKRLCLKPGCPNRTTRDYCDECMKRKTTKPRTATTHKGGYDWTWAKLSKFCLSQEPLCRRCQEREYIKAADVSDHIIPLRYGGERLLRSNIQSLCRACNAIKAKIDEERFSGGASSAYPVWLPPPSCPVTLVLGPPGAGKTTYCAAHATQDDVIIELDECFTTVCGVHGHHADRIYLDTAIHYRNRLLSELQGREKGRGYFNLSTPLPAEQRWWIEKLRADPIVINPGIDVCLQRRPNRQDEVRSWFRRRELHSVDYQQGGWV